jgi:2-oxoisovalerate dehydrogenase E1 component
VAIGIDPAQNHLEMGLDDAALIDVYRTMVLARRLDDRAWALNRQGRTPFVVSSSGHEGAQVGAAQALDPTQDWSLPYYRDMAYVLALGMTAEEVLLGVLSKATDPTSGGRQMPNHWSLPRLNILSASSSIGVQFTQAAGIAYEMKRAARPGIVYVSGGEGATSGGDLHEAMNFAAIHQLPVLFLIQNNQYAISVPAEENVAGDLAARAAAYGMAAESIDGNDALEVYRAVSQARTRGMAGEGPTFIEARTYRYYAHTSDDDDKLYRSAEEVEQWRKRDPIGLLRRYLIESRLLSDEQEGEIEEWATDEVAAALQRAEEAPDAEDAFGHVYSRPIENTTAATTVDEPPPGEEVNFVTAVNRALDELMDEQGEVVVFGQDVADPKGGVFKATVGLTEHHGRERAFNTPLAESLIAGMAVGMAVAGAKPVAEIQFADFIHPSFDQLVSEAARMHYRSAGDWQVPMVLRAPYGGGIHGALYHSQSIEAFYAHVPGLKVVVPSTPADAKGLLRSAVDDPDPVLFLEPKKLYRLAKGPYPEGDHRVPIGTAALRRDGTDLVIVAYGTMAHFAVEAAATLADQGVDAAVLDLRSIRPLDWASIEAAVQRTSKVLVVHEDNEFLGFGAEISAQIMEKAFDWLDAPVQRYCAAEVPAFPFASALEDQVMPNVAGIVERAADLAAY